eukprot:31550-Pelagococcus_subviridis.AAC.20
MYDTYNRLLFSPLPSAGSYNRYQLSSVLCTTWMGDRNASAHALSVSSSPHVLGFRISLAYALNSASSSKKMAYSSARCEMWSTHASRTA